MAALAGAAGVSVGQLALGSPLLPSLVVFGSALLVVPCFMACSAWSVWARLVAEDTVCNVLVGEGDDAAQRDDGRIGPFGDDDVGAVDQRAGSGRGIVARVGILGSGSDGH